MNKRFALALASIVGVVSQAHAALPTGVDTAITSAQTDGLALVGLLAAAGAGVFIIAKLLRKFGVML